MAGEQIAACSVGVGEVRRGAGVVQIVVDPFAALIDTVLHPHRSRKLLVGAGEAGLAKNIQNNRLLQSVGECGAFVGKRARAELVARDGRPAPEEGMIIESQRLGGRRHEELRPRADLVIRVRDMPRVVFERQRVLEVGELLVGEAGRFAERAGSALPADSGVLVGEAALERHEDVAAAVNVIGDLLQQGIIGNVKRRNDEQFVGREIRILREDKVGAHVRLVERAVQLREDGIVSARGFTRHPSQLLLPFERHEADRVGRIDAVEDRHLILDLEVDDLGADLLQFVRDP